MSMLCACCFPAEYDGTPGAADSYTSYGNGYYTYGQSATVSDFQVGGTLTHSLKSETYAPYFAYLIKFVNFLWLSCTKALHSKRDMHTIVLGQ